MSYLRHKVKLKADNSSGVQHLYIDLDHPDIPDDEVSLTLVGNYRGEDIQIDFEEIKKEEFAETLQFMLSQINQKP